MQSFQEKIKAMANPLWPFLCRFTEEGVDYRIAIETWNNLYPGWKNKYILNSTESSRGKSDLNGPRDKRYILSGERLTFFGRPRNQWPTSRGMDGRFGMEYAKKFLPRYWAFLWRSTIGLSCQILTRLATLKTGINQNRKRIMQIGVPEYLARAEKAYKNLDFLNRKEARTLRILAEYEHPEQVFLDNGVKNTVVFFGSSRILPKNRFEEKLFVLKAALKNAKGKQKKELELKLTSMEHHRNYCRYYDEAVELSRLVTEWCLKLPKSKQFIICSGGGYGIMEAANRGAFEAGGESIGLNISLPFEKNPNPYITPKFNFEFHYFYMRKLWFMYYAKALVVFPGGFGTLDELFELLTLVQTEKITKPLLIILYGESYWRNIINFNGLVEAGMISEKDLSLFSYINNPKAAFKFLKDRLPKHLV